MKHRIIEIAAIMALASGCKSHQTITTRNDTISLQQLRHDFRLQRTNFFVDDTLTIWRPYTADTTVGLQQPIRITRRLRAQSETDDTRAAYSHSKKMESQRNVSNSEPKQSDSGRNFHYISAIIALVLLLLMFSKSSRQ